MKSLKIFFAAVILFTALGRVDAQVDVKVNPVGFMFKRYTASVEFGVADNIGVEVVGGFTNPNFTFTLQGEGGVEKEEEFRANLIRAGLNGRYYFNPKRGLDGFYTGVYSRFAGGKLTTTASDEKATYQRIGAGLLLGAKIVAANEHLVFDFGLGLGRALRWNIDFDNSEQAIDLDEVPLLRWDVPIHISIGYRF